MNIAPLKVFGETCEDKKGKKAPAPPKDKVPAPPKASGAKEKEKEKESPAVSDAKTEGARGFHVFRGAVFRSRRCGKRPMCTYIKQK